MFSDKAHPTTITHQASLLSTDSDYDVLDADECFTDIELEIEDGSVPTKLRRKLCFGFLRKNKSISIKVKLRETYSRGPDLHNYLAAARLYDIECSHDGYHWSLVRKYHHFEDLHNALRSSRPQSSALRTSTQKDRTNSESGNELRYESHKKPLRFPKKPEIFITSVQQHERRRKRLEDYLIQVISDPRYRVHEATMKFLEISHISFKKHSGEKYHEGLVEKRSGGRKFPTLLSCFSPTASQWNTRWLVLKDSYMCYLRPNRQIADVLLFDDDVVNIKTGFKSTGIHHGMKISTNCRELSLKTSSYYKTRNWASSVERAVGNSEYACDHRFESFAPERKELANWYVDGESYFADVAQALENAKEEIFITDWWLSPVLHMKRPVYSKTDSSRLDLILQHKAQEGVKVHVLLYKDIKMAVGGIRSDKCREHLENLHQNIMVLRHPDHLKSSVILWTHHEKIVCVDQKIAFVGGLDLCFGRWDNQDHCLTDLGSVKSVAPTPPRSGSFSSQQWKGIGASDVQKPVYVHKNLGSLKIHEHKKASRSFSDIVNINARQRNGSLKPSGDGKPGGDGRLETFISSSNLKVVNDSSHSHHVRKHRSRSLGADLELLIGDRNADETRIKLQKVNTASNGNNSHKVLKKASTQDSGLFQRESQTLDDDVFSMSPKIEVTNSDVTDKGEISNKKAASGSKESLSHTQECSSKQETNSVDATPSKIPTVDAGNHIEGTSSRKSMDESRLTTILDDRSIQLPSRSNSLGSLQMEPLHEIVGKVVKRQRKARGKTPQPPSSSAFAFPDGEKIVVSQDNEGDGQSQDKEGEKKNLEEQPSHSIVRGRSWKRIRSNLDKIRTVWRHQEAVRRGSLGDVDAKRSSGISTPAEHGLEGSAKYWIGKDYVNWIYKDLDTAKAPYQDTVDRFTTVRMPWHDIACVVFNTAATDVARHFIQRWNHAKKGKATSKSNEKYPLLLPRSTKTSYKRLPDFVKDKCELVKCQVLRSCSGWSSGLQRTEHSIYNAYLDLIEKAEHYIYIENQFFISWCGTEISNCVCEALVNRILKAHQEKKLFRVFIVLPLLPAFEADLDPQTSGGSALFAVLHWIQQSLISHKNSLFQKLNSHRLDPSAYVSVCSLRKHDTLNTTPVTELIYVHSKLMIVDDRRCIIGSANINDRSLSGERDSEVAVVIEDDLLIDSVMSEQPYKAGKFCYSLRNHLFQEHLGLPATEFVQDITCDEFYKNQWMATAAKNTSMFEKVFNCIPNDSIGTFDELRENKTKTPMAVSEPVEARRMLINNVKGQLVLYSLHFLSRENLIEKLSMKERVVPMKFWT